MGAGDFNISVRLDAGVSGTQDVKALTLNLKDLFAEAGGTGSDKITAALKEIKNEAVATQKILVEMGKSMVESLKGPADSGSSTKLKQVRDEAKATAAAAAALGKEFAHTFKGDVTSGLKTGLEQADARVNKLTADLRAMYAAKATGDPTGVVRQAIEQTEARLARANRELARFKELSGNVSASPSTPAAPANVGGGALGGLGIGSLVGGLTIASLLTQTINASLGLMKDAFTSIVSEGIKMNEFLEISQFGIATAVQAQYNLKDAQGKVLEGQEAYNAALVISAEQMKAIRIAGLETAATSQQLVANYQTAVGVGASAGITDLTKLRQLTIDVTNAATALGVSQQEVPTAIRAVITGREVEQNQLARILVGTGEQVRQWQMSGKLLDELNKRLAPFSAGAKQAAGSWAVVKSNIEEAFQVFSGEVTSGMFQNLRDAAGEVLSGIFDTENLGISESFSEITSVVKAAFDGLGVVIVDMLKGAVSMAKEFNTWLSDNKETIDEWKQGFKEIWVAVKGILTSIFDVSKASVGVKKETGELSIIFTTVSVVLKGIALLIAGVADGVRTIGAGVIWLAGLLLDGILQPLRSWLNMMGEGLNAVKKGWGDGLINVGKAIDGVGAKVRKVGADLFDPIANGTGAVQKVLGAFRDTGKAIEDTSKKAKDASATVAGAKNPIKKEAGMSASQAVAKAEADEAVALAKDALARQQRDLDYQLSQQLISIRDYYAKRQEAQLESLRIDLAAKEKEKAANAAALPKTLDEEQTKKAASIKLQTEINILRRKEGDIITENTQKETAANLSLTNKVLELRAQLEQLTGSQTSGVAAAQIEEKFRLIRLQMVTQFGEGAEAVKLVDRIVDVEKSKANFAIIQAQYNQTMDAMKLKEQEINQAAAAGAIGPLEATRQLTALHQETALKLTEILPMMQAYAEKVGDPTMINNVARLKLELTGVANAQTELGKSMDAQATNALAAFFNDVASQSKSAGDAIKDFGRSVLNTFMNLINQQLAKQLMASLFQGSSGGSAGFWSGLIGSFAGKAGGGAVRGPGTSTSDSIPTMLSDGEYVLRASAVSRLGMGFLDMLNGISSRPLNGHFADGGPASSVGPSQVSVNPRIVNLFDPSMLDDLLSTPRGEKTILNVIASNPLFMKAILA